MNDPAMNRFTAQLTHTRVKHRLGLFLHGLPLAILGIGLLAWTLVFSPENAGAQSPFNQPQYSNTPSYGNGSNLSIPSAAMNSAASNSSDPNNASQGNFASANVSEDNASTSSEAWLLPGFAKKVMAGGWLMLPLGVCSLIVFALSLERMVALRRGRVIPRPFVRRFTECVEDGQLSFEEATEICEEFDCPVAEVFQAAVRRWGRPMLEIEQAVIDAGDRVADGLRRFLRVFHAISNVAPLIGLLGTVLGMIDGFEAMSSQEAVGRPDMLASGISTALITTAGGLSVAIPAYLAYMYFSSKSDKYLHEIDKLCQKVIDCISAEGLESSGNARTARKRKAA